jgi:hypothetical protein
MMKPAVPNFDEARVAAEIVSILDPAVLRACSPERDVIRYAVRGLKLRTIVFDRDALQRLLESEDAAVKIEYLKRDLLRTAAHRSEYRYPRASVARTHAEQPEKERAAI